MSDKAKEELKKETSTDEVMEVKKIKLSGKVQLIFSIGAILWIIICVYLFSPPENPNDPNGIRRVASKNLDYGILTATVGGTAMDIDPNAYITVELIDSGIAWEIIVNGIVVNRFRADGTEDKSVKPGRVGTRDTVVYRVIEGQSAGTMRLAYVKHRDEKPPLGWFGAAKKLL